jgi:hypothetical protein
MIRFNPNHALLPLNRMFTFNSRSFLATIGLLATEIIIALFINDQFIRPYFGDFLVVILIYCFIRTFIQSSAWPVALFVLIFSFTVEILQYCNLIKTLGLENNEFAKAVLGTSFSWNDIIMYVIGVISAIVLDNILLKKQIKASPEMAV